MFRSFKKNYSKALAKDIKDQSSTLEGTSDLNKILTIQNQLNSLPVLHDQKPVTSLIFSYIKQFTPAKASIASIKTEFDLQTMDITGSADSINTINKFVDTLKFTSYSVTYNEGEQKTNCLFQEVSYDSATRIQVCMVLMESAEPVISIVCKSNSVLIDAMLALASKKLTVYSKK